MAASGSPAMKRIMKPLRRLLEWSYAAYAWCVFSLVLLLFGGLAVLLRRPSYARPAARAAARAMLVLTRMPVSAQGRRRLPHGPHILLVNHTSFLDPLVLIALLPALPGYAFVTRQQYRSQALLCPLVRALGAIVMRDRGALHNSSNVSLLRIALRRGDNLVIFPEGRFVPEEGLGHFHSGAFVAAASEKVPIVIAGLHGARTALRLGSWLPRRAAIELRIGAVLMPDGKDAVSLSRLSEEAREAMLPLTGEKDAET
jgi:1-acyl-sn-glycerol-3-phosphate acyltransferase